MCVCVCVCVCVWVCVCVQCRGPKKDAIQQDMRRNGINNHEPKRVCVTNCVNQPRNLVCVTSKNEVDNEVMMNEQKNEESDWLI